MKVSLNSVSWCYQESFIESASTKISSVKKDFLSEKSLVLTKKLVEIDEKLAEFSQICSGSAFPNTMTILNTTYDDPETMEGPLTTESAEENPTPRQAYLQSMDSGRSRNKSPIKLKLRDNLGKPRVTKTTAWRVQLSKTMTYTASSRISARRSRR